MLIVCQPSELNQADSARVENRGPSITTMVPPSCTPMPSSRVLPTMIARIVAQYGSANEMCVVTGPS
jgi:hypothetical protein